MNWTWRIGLVLLNVLGLQLHRWGFGLTPVLVSGGLVGVLTGFKTEFDRAGFFELLKIWGIAAVLDLLLWALLGELP